MDLFEKKCTFRNNVCRIVKKNLFILIQYIFIQEISPEQQTYYSSSYSHFNIDQTNVDLVRASKAATGPKAAPVAALVGGGVKPAKSLDLYGVLSPEPARQELIKSPNKSAR